jgi:hypothetical protein
LVTTGTIPQSDATQVGGGLDHVRSAWHVAVVVPESVYPPSQE